MFLNFLPIFSFETDTKKNLLSPKNKIGISNNISTKKTIKHVKRHDNFPPFNSVEPISAQKPGWQAQISLNISADLSEQNP